MNPIEPLSQAIAYLLAVFYSIVPNLGISIILLTLTVMMVLFPLTAKQTRSMIAMQRVQPEIKKIQQQYKDDRQKQNEELLKFYQENKINPLSGCLPLLIQMPVLFALFDALRHIVDRVPETGQFNQLYVALCGDVMGGCDAPNGLYFAGMNMLVSPQDSGSITDGFVQRLPYFIAVALVMLAGWYQQYQTLRRQKDQAKDNPMLKQMQMLSRVFPIVFGYFSFIASSGLVLYFLTSSLFRIGQQHLVLSKYYDEADAKASKSKTIEATSSSPADASAPTPGPSPHAARKKKKRRR